MAAQANTVKVIDNNQVAPPAGSVPTTTLPLTFFDIPFVYFGPPVQRIFFYELPYPMLQFTQSVFPCLRESLSLTLRHFYPLAANLACTQPLYEPSILYNEVDAVKVATLSCRERFLSEIPANYFGNCLTYILVPAKRRELLMGESGIVFAANAIGRKINELGNIGALKGVENWIPNITEAFKRGPPVVVASSPKFQVYNTDFGWGPWGRPKKFDMVHIAAYTCFSLSESRDDDGGLDIGIIVGRDKMDIFNAIFEQQLNTC